MAIHGIGVSGFLGRVLRRQVNHQLMAEEIEVDPVVAGPSFFQAEYRAVKMSRCGQVVDGDGQVKRG
ncbi:hypothetical protein D3C84_901510 [compost metagenome]